MCVNLHTFSDLYKMSISCTKCDPCHKGNNLTQCADLSLTIATVTGDTSVSFLFNVINNGPLSSSIVVLTVTFIGDSPIFTPIDGWSVIGQTATYTYGVLPVGPAPIVPIITFTGTSSVNAVVLATETPECYLPNNSATATIIIPG